MAAIRIGKTIESETLYLPELKPLIGKSVEIIVTEIVPATREEFYAEAGHVPEQTEEKVRQQEIFQAWRCDPRFERFWPLIDRLLAVSVAGTDNGETAPHHKAAS